MTPTDKIKFKDQAQCRAIVLNPVAQGEKRFDTDYYVEGIAARYEQYLLYDGGDYGKIYERFERGCFDNTDMSDVIFQFDHEGRVFARSTNNTLVVEPTDVGLFVAADLGKTERARDIHGDIVAEMLTKMSWRWRCGDYYTERTEGSKDITIVHTRIAKIYDVSVVSIPANDNTEINARDFAHGVMDEITRREAELEERRRKLRTKISNTLGGKQYGSYR